MLNMSAHIFQGSSSVSAPRDRVWEMLQDPQVLVKVVPGLSDAVAEQGGQMRATLSVNMGPVKGKFKTLVRVLNAKPPEYMELEVEGKTITGTALLHTEMTLTDLGETTRIDWVATPKLSGLLAGVGGKLIESKARDAGAGQRYADRFFGRLSQEA